MEKKEVEKARQEAQKAAKKRLEELGMISQSSTQAKDLKLDLKALESKLREANKESEILAAKLAEAEAKLKLLETQNENPN